MAEEHVALPARGTAAAAAVSTTFALPDCGAAGAPEAPALAPEQLVALM
jgi:hypothetical protein